MRAILLILIIGTSVSVYGQSTISVIGGFTVSQLHLKGFSQNSLKDFTPRYTGHIGSMAEMPISKQSNVRIGAIYAPRGAQFKSGLAFWPANLGAPMIRLDYIEIPALYMRRVKGTELFAGPQFSTLLSAKAVNKSEKNDIKDRMKNLVVEGRFGVGINRGRSTLEIAYVQPLTPVFKAYEQIRWTNSTLTISLKYRLIELSAKATDGE